MKTICVALGEACEVLMGQSPPSSSYSTTPDGLPFFQGKADFGATHPTIRVFCNQPTRIAEPGDILISVRAPVGPTNLVHERCCIGRGLAAVRPGSKLSTQFLLYFLRFREPNISAMGKGSTFEAINRDVLENLKVPLLPLTAQQRIAGILEQAERMLRTRRYAIELSDTFLPAAFLELFGSPSSAKRRFSVSELGEETAFIDYRGIAPNKVDRGVRLVTARNIKRGFFELEPQEFIPADEYDSWMRRGMPKAGDILFTTEGHTLGSAAKLPRFDKVALAQRLIALQPRSRLTSDYTLQLILTRWFQEEVAKRSTGSAARGISSKQLAEIPIPIPPVPLQQQFSFIAEGHERLRAGHQEALRQAEHLFQSLLHRAFTNGL